MTLARRARLSGLLALCCGFLLLSCEDPSGVGLTVIDFGETDPRARIIPAETELDTLVDATGAVRPAAGQFLGRFLAGRAEDPYFGTIEAQGYIGFIRPDVFPPGYLAGTVDEAILSLRSNYVFGDTSLAATFDVYEIDRGWSALTFRADSTLDLGKEPITSFEISASDTLVSVNLPESWVAARDTVLRADNFADAFHGFAVLPRPDNQMVVGFTGQTRLLGIRITDTNGNGNGNGNGTVQADTVVYPSIQVASTIERDLKTANPPPDLIPLQDGAGDGLYLNLRLDTLDTPAIAGGFVRVEADTLLLEQGIPGTFVRPLARTIALYGVRDDGPPVLLAESRLNDENSSYTFASTQLNLVLQDMLLDRSIFDRMAIGFLSVPSSVNVAPLTLNPEQPPRVVLIVSPTN